MGSHRRNWGWWLAAAIAVAVAASLFLHRKPLGEAARPEAPAGQAEAPVPPAASSSAGSPAPEVSSSPAVPSAPAGEETAVTVVRDTVYVTLEDESVPVVRERKVETGEREEDTPAATTVTEMTVSVPVKDLNGLVRGKSGRDISVTTAAPDRITLSYAGKIDVPMLGEQIMNFSADFKVVEVSGDRLVLQLDSGAAVNLAAELIAPRVLPRLPAGLVESFSGGRAVVNLSAVPQLKKRLSGVSLTGVSVDAESIHLRAVEK